MARRLLGTAVTDENGEATIEYTGTGAGELHIVAESGTFSSNVITIDDYDPIIDSATITSDKNIIQSGESANLTVIGKDKHNELVNEDTFDLCEQFIISKVSVDSTGIVQSGSNLDIKAKVNTSLGGVPNNVPVVFKKGDETLDTVQTSASGVATYPYPGTGVGEVNITAECDGVVSGTYTVWDTQFYDSGVTGTKNTKWFCNNWNKISVGDTGTTIEEVTSTSINYAVATTSQTSTWGDRRTFSKGFAVELDIVEYQNHVYLAFTDTSDVGIPVINLADADHVKVIVNDSTYQVFKDGVDVTPSSNTHNMGANVRVALMTTTEGVNGKLTFTNFKVYSI